MACSCPERLMRTVWLGKPHDRAVLQAAGDRIGHRCAALFLDDVENDLHRFPPGLLGRPAGQGFGDRIQVFDSAARIGRNDTVADAMKSNLGALLLVKQRFLGSLAIGDVENGPQDLRRSTAPRAKYLSLRMDETLSHRWAVRYRTRSCKFARFLELSEWQRQLRCDHPHARGSRRYRA